AFNTAGSRRGLVTVGAARDLGYSLIATNDSLSGSAPDCQVGGSLANQGHNLIGDTADCGWTAGTGDVLDPDVPLGLGPLALNGGLSQTHEPEAGSPALDAGNDTTCAAADQRGLARPLDGDID